MSKILCEILCLSIFGIRDANKKIVCNKKKVHTTACDFCVYGGCLGFGEQSLGFFGHSSDMLVSE